MAPVIVKGYSADVMLEVAARADRLPKGWRLLGRVLHSIHPTFTLPDLHRTKRTCRGKQPDSVRHRVVIALG
jgi:hypothetical protein